MAVTIAAICDGIESTLALATGINTGKSYDEITEGVPARDCPRIHVYPDTIGPDDRTRTERTTFQAGLQQLDVSVFVDVYARQRSQLPEDMKAAVTTLDNLITVLQAQEVPPFFGVTGIKAFRWSWRRAVFRLGNAKYMGGRFLIVARVY